MTRRKLLGPSLAAVYMVFATGAAIMSTVREVTGPRFESVALLIPSTCFALVGTLIIVRGSRNRMGWIFYAIGLLWASGHFAGEYAAFSYEERSLPGSLLAAWYGEWYWLPWLFLLLAGSFILFPDGNLPGRRWRPFGYGLLGAVVVLTVLAALDARLNIANSSVTLDNPIGISPLGDPDEDPLAFPFVILLWGSAVGSLTALVVRFRRARGDERLQMKWFVYASALLLFSFLALVIYDTASGQRVTVLDTIMLSLSPIAAGAAILKYRLYDIDVVINKTIVFGVLAAFITGIYVAIVVGIGTLLGSQDEPNLALSIAATAIVAIAFSPVKERTQRLANRLVYGHRLSPYDVLTDLSRSVATASSPNEVLVAVAHAAAVGVNAKGARVLLRMQDGSPVEERFPPDSSEQGAGEVFEVSHEAELLGQISVAKGAGDPLTPQDRRLLDDLSGQAGLALYNARLAIELRARLDEISTQADELQGSRARIVSAADDARRRLERDITEGPRKDLVTLRARLENVLAMVETDPETAAGDLESLTEDANRTLDALRELARGIYPPLLADQGIVAAVESHIRKRDLEVEVRTDEEMRVARFDESIETTVYFCCVEALDRDGVAAIDMALSRGELRVEIHGGGRDAERETIIGDRVEAHGGRVEHRSDSLVFRLPVVERAEPQPEVVAQAASSASGPN
jgi:signal transduction histidine kinase